MTDIDLNNVFDNVDIPKLNKTEAESLDGPITHAEAYITGKFAK